jgi:hypothetical protein
MTNAIDHERGAATIGNPPPDLYAEGSAGRQWRDRIGRRLERGYRRAGLVLSVRPHDPLELDAVSPPILADVTGKNGQTLMVPDVIHGGTTG